LADTMGQLVYHTSFQSSGTVLDFLTPFAMTFTSRLRLFQPCALDVPVD
jgi:hypothetical protein